MALFSGGQDALEGNLNHKVDGARDKWTDLSLNYVTFFLNPSLWELFPSCREPDRKQKKHLVFFKRTFPWLSLCGWVLLTTQREERTQTMKQVPCPHFVSVGKEQNQGKAIEQTQWLCLLPFWRYKAGWDTLFCPQPTPLFPGLPAPRLPVLRSPVLPRHLDSPDCSFKPPTSIAASQRDFEFMKQFEGKINCPYL